MFSELIFEQNAAKGNMSEEKERFPFWKKNVTLPPTIHNPLSTWLLYLLIEGLKA